MSDQLDNKGMKRASKYSLEVCYQIWDDADGTRCEVSEDRDGLGLVDIAQVDEKGKRHTVITVTREQARLIANALQLHVSKPE